MTDDLPALSALLRDTLALPPLQQPEGAASPAPPTMVPHSVARHGEGQHPRQATPSTTVEALQSFSAAQLPSPSPWPALAATPSPATPAPLPAGGSRAEGP